MRYKRLKVFYIMLCIITSIVNFVALFISYKKMRDRLETSEIGETRQKAYYTLVLQWLRNPEQDVSKFFQRNNYKKIAIYGMGTLGELLYEKLEQSRDIEVVGFVEKNTDARYFTINHLVCLSLEDIQNMQADVLVITPINAEEEIRGDLAKYGCKQVIVSLKDVVNQM